MAVEALRAQITDALQSTDIELAERLMDEALELDDADELDDLLVELEMHTEKLRSRPAAAQPAPAPAPAPAPPPPPAPAPAPAPPPAPAPAPAPAPPPLPAAAPDSPAPQPPPSQPESEAPAGGATDTTAAAVAATGRVERVERLQAAPTASVAPTPAPTPTPAAAAGSLFHAMAGGAAVSDGGGGPAAGSAFRAMAAGGGGGTGEVAEDSSGGWGLGWASELSSAISDLSKVTAGVSEATASVVGQAVASAVADLNEPGPQMPAPLLATGAGQSGAMAAGGGAPRASQESKQPTGRATGPRGLIGALGAIAAADYSAAPAPAAEEEEQEDSEVDAQIGFTGRLRLAAGTDEEEQEMLLEVWSAFFGAPSCSLEERRLVPAEPARADTELLNADSLAGSLALASRGGCSFAEKARRLQAAGALGVVFVNSESDAELHPAADITEHHGGASTMDITIPVVCVGLGVATRAGLVDALTTGRSWGRAGLELVSEWVAVPDCPAETAGRILSVDLRLGARPDGDGSNWSLQVYSMEDGAGVATLVQEVPIHVQVESAERQTIPLFKAVGQTLRVEVGQFVGLASADGPMHLARLSSTGAPGFWYANTCVAAGPAAVTLLKWEGALDFSIAVEDSQPATTAAAAGPNAAASGQDGGGGGWGWGSAWGAASNFASSLVGADEGDEDPMAQLKAVASERLKQPKA